MWKWEVGVVLHLTQSSFPSQMREKISKGLREK